MSPNAPQTHVVQGVVPEYLRTKDQRILRFLLNIVLLWSIVTFVVDMMYELTSVTPVMDMFGNFTLFTTFLTGSALPIAGFALSIVMIVLGYRGVRNPYKIGPFFTIIFIDAMLLGWDMASQISLGQYHLTYMLYCCMIIATAYFAWQVKKTTYPDDWFEQKEAAKALKKQAKLQQKERDKEERLLKREARTTK